MRLIQSSVSCLTQEALGKERALSTDEKLPKFLCLLISYLLLFTHGRSGAVGPNSVFRVPVSMCTLGCLS